MAIAMTTKNDVKHPSVSTSESVIITLGLQGKSYPLRGHRLTQDGIVGPIVIDGTSFTREMSSFVSRLIFADADAFTTELLGKRCELGRLRAIPGRERKGDEQAKLESLRSQEAVTTGEIVDQKVDYMRGLKYEYVVTNDITVGSEIRGDFVETSSGCDRGFVPFCVNGIITATDWS